MIQLPYRDTTVARMQTEEIARARRGVFRPPRRLTWVAWGAVTLITLLPLVIYMDLGQADLLLLIMFLVYGAQMVVSLRTALLASELVARLLRMAGNWDLLVMTGLDSRQTIWGTWAAVMQVRYRAHLRVGVLRLGAIIGMAQYLHSAPLPGQVIGVFLPGALPFQIAQHPAFLYVSYPWVAGPELLFPALTGLLLAIPLLILFALLEAAIVTAAGVFVGIVFGEYETLRAIAGASVRVVMMIAAMTILLTTAGSNIDILREGRCERPTLCSSYSANDPRREAAFEDARNTLRIRETAQIALSPWVDGGVMVGALLARPDTNQYTRSGDFMTRVGVAAGVSALSLAFVGWILLVLAQVAAISRGMAPSPNR